MPRPLRIVIIEDSRQQAVELRNILEVLGFEVMTTFYDMEGFRAGFRDKSFDLAVVDIRLGGDKNYDGLAIVKFLQQQPKMLVLINTAYEEKRIWSVLRKTDRIAIVGKPSPYPHTWRSAINSLLYGVYGSKAADMYHLPDGSRSPGYLFEKTQADFYFKDKRFRYGSIHYVEAAGNSSINIYRDNRVTFCSGSRFKDFFKACKHSNLVQIHRSHVVNWDLVEEANLTRVVLELPNGERKAFSVGPSYKEEVRSRVIRLPNKKQGPGKN